jgi:hypothetical protein
LLLTDGTRRCMEAREAHDLGDPTGEGRRIHPPTAGSVSSHWACGGLVVLHALLAVWDRRTPVKPTPPGDYVSSQCRVIEYLKQRKGAAVYGIIEYLKQRKGAAIYGISFILKIPTPTVWGPVPVHAKNGIQSQSPNSKPISNHSTSAHPFTGAAPSRGRCCHHLRKQLHDSASCDAATIYGSSFMTVPAAMLPPFTEAAS